MSHSSSERRLVALRLLIKILQVLRLAFRIPEWHAFYCPATERELLARPPCQEHVYLPDSASQSQCDKLAAAEKGVCVVLKVVCIDALLAFARKSDEHRCSVISSPFTVCVYM
jgi:hypothetical protein